MPSTFRVALRASLVLALVACGSTSSPSPVTSSTVQGRVTSGPTCAVRRCPPQPVSAPVTARAPDHHIVATTHTDANGRYRIRLPSGRYTLSVTTNGLPRCKPIVVRVPAHATVTSNLTCQSGRL